MATNQQQKKQSQLPMKLKEKRELKMYVRVGNSGSAEDSAVSCRTSALCKFWGYDANGCVCGGVNTGADSSDLLGNTAPARWNKQIF